MRWVLLFFVLVPVSCGTKNPSELAQYLNGYWEIEKVTLPDGTVKEFNVNTTIDFIEMKEGEGIRRKVAPKLNGTFEASNDYETFKINSQGNTLLLEYKTPFSAWIETVIKANATQLIVKNSNGMVYQYKHFTPINTD